MESKKGFNVHDGKNIKDSLVRWFLQKYKISGGRIKKTIKWARKF